MGQCSANSVNRDRRMPQGWGIWRVSDGNAGSIEENLVTQDKPYSVWDFRGDANLHLLAQRKWGPFQLELIDLLVFPLDSGSVSQSFLHIQVFPTYNNRGIAIIFIL